VQPLVHDDLEHRERDDAFGARSAAAATHSALAAVMDCARLDGDERAGPTAPERVHAQKAPAYRRD